MRGGSGGITSSVNWYEVSLAVMLKVRVAPTTSSVPVTLIGGRPVQSVSKTSSSPCQLLCWQSSGARTQRKEILQWFMTAATSEAGAPMMP